jgi:hypothetical protein
MQEAMFEQFVVPLRAVKDLCKISRIALGEYRFEKKSLFEAFSMHINFSFKAEY